MREREVSPTTCLLVYIRWTERRGGVNSIWSWAAHTEPKFDAKIGYCSCCRKSPLWLLGLLRGGLSLRDPDHVGQTNSGFLSMGPSLALARTLESQGFAK